MIEDKLLRLNHKGENEALQYQIDYKSAATPNNKFSNIPRPP